MNLTARQREALAACVLGNEHPYWRGQSDGNKRAGRRNTLGSLARLGLVEYHNGWRATDAGREAYVANIKDTP